MRKNQIEVLVKKLWEEKNWEKSDRMIDPFIFFEIELKNNLPDCTKEEVEYAKSIQMQYIRDVIKDTFGLS